MCEIKNIISFPDTVGIVVNISEAGEDQAMFGVVSTGLREPGPALTTGLVLIFQDDNNITKASWIVDTGYTYTTQNLTLLIVRDRGEDIH